MERRNALFKSQADTAFRHKEYKLALQCYDMVNFLHIIYDA
jgi:hypothetical protein